MGGTTGTIVISLYTGFTHIHRVKLQILFIITYMILFMKEVFLLVKKGGKITTMLAQLRVSHDSKKFPQNVLEKAILK